jgi:hypothetical protein
MDVLREDYLVAPLVARYAPRHRNYSIGMALHATSVAIGLPTYRDPSTGNAVFTAAFLADRGYCCNSGCRHCPYAPVGLDDR